MSRNTIVALICLVLALGLLLIPETTGSQGNTKPTQLAQTKTEAPLPTPLSTEAMEAAPTVSESSTSEFSTFQDQSAIVSAETNFLEIQVETLDSCSLSVLQALNKSKSTSEGKVPWSVFGPLIMSESSGHQWEPNSKTGKCEVKIPRDGSGNPILAKDGNPAAYGLAQIYASVHPQYDLAKLKSDPDYNLNAGIDILLAFKNGSSSWDEAVRKYKALGPNGSLANYKNFQANGFKDLATGQHVTFGP